jgi:hypothetical protein
MPSVDWQQALFKKDGLHVDTEQFWIGLFQHKAFKVLVTSPLTRLITTVSNAVAERIFSLVSSVKIKARNIMLRNHNNNNILLDVTVRVRVESLLSCQCCKDFTASPEILKNFTGQGFCRKPQSFGG